MRPLRSPQMGRRKTCFMILVAGTILSIVVIMFSPEDESRNLSLPLSGGRRLSLPNFDHIWEMEQNLPQHNLSLPFPEGNTGRYVKFSNQVYMLGWNNVLAESLLASHLAWRAKRAYVFQDYRWNPEHFPWTIEGVPMTPVNALVSGPMVGGSWGLDDPSPRAVSEKWFDVVCPKEEVKTLEAAVEKEPVRGKTAQEVMDYWVKLLSDLPDRCVNIISGKGDPYPQTFDLWTISSPKIIPLWKEFSTGPVSRLLRTSPLVDSAVRANEHLLFPASSETSRPTARYETMLAVHLRRGDYLEACKGFADWNSTFFGWNILPGLPDRLKPGPPVGEGIMGQNTPQNYEMFRKRCVPNEEELISRIHEIRADWESGSARRQKLRTLFIMTNAKRDWLNLAVKKLSADGWDTVVTSKDFILNSEQMAVGMSADMEIGRKAAVFVGNGWSSMTSNIVHRRLVDGQSYESCRFL